MRTTIRSNWSTTILVCSKCSKKLKRGFGEHNVPLAKALKQFGGGKKRKAPFGVIETRCLDICPKGAVVAVNATHPGTWLLVREGMAIEDAADLLGLAGSSEQPRPA